MAVISWGRINLKDILKRRLFSKNVLKAIAAIAVLLIVLIALNNLIFPSLGFRFLYDSGRFKVEKVLRYSEEESRVLKILLRDTAILGEIPQREYLKSKTGLENEVLATCLASLEDKCDITLADNGMIVDAYPWTSRDTGILVFLSGDDQSLSGPIECASALHAMSVMPFLELSGKIKAVLEDSRDTLLIEIEKNEIVFTNNVAAVVYRTDDYQDSRFFASYESPGQYYGDEFELNRVIRLDRALLIGDIIGGEIKDKIEE